MCIVIVKPENVKLPKRSILMTCFDNNSDGAGFMYVRDGKVNIRKGFMDYDSFIDAVEKERLNRSEPIVFHFRISTCAEVAPQFCHPFPISKSYHDMNKLSSECETGIAHNGIIHVNTKNDASDTMIFTKNILYYIPVKMLMNSTTTQKTIGKLVSNSKFAIMHKDGNVVLIGDGWVKHGGCYYSNDTYKEYDLSFDYKSFYSYSDFASPSKRDKWEVPVCPICGAEMSNNEYWLECPSCYYVDHVTRRDRMGDDTWL